MKKFIFDLIRPLFVKDIDPNEDYNCMECGTPVLRRILYCSTKCSRKFASKMLGKDIP